MTFLLIVANILGAGMVVPQVIHLHRYRSLDGVSSAWTGVGIAMNAWWIIYAFGADILGVLPVSILGVALYATMAAQVIRIDRRQIRPVLMGGLAIGSVPGVALAIGGWPGAGLAIGLCYGIQFAPAAIAAVRSERLTGISAPTWIMAFTEAVIWAIYGLPINDPALILGGVGGSIASAIILIRLASETRAPKARRGMPSGPLNPGMA